ncbi:MAG: hypothetical protein B6242_05025 [Anaerolineaceae bacterium 4572_78]|nr:MAG: hypothetical protein B6242_05025 [Anaerolineaceae bacterium 4572_78]
MDIKKHAVKGAINLFLEKPAQKKSLAELADKLEKSGEKLDSHLTFAEDTPSHRRKIRHIIGIERWGQRRLQVILGEEWEDPDKVEDDVDDARPDDEVDDALPDDEVDDARPDDEMDDARPDDEMDDALPDDEVDDARPDDEMDDARPDDEMDDARPDDEMDDYRSDDEMDNYIPNIEYNWVKLQIILRETRAKTVAIVHRLEEANVNQNTTIPHNEFGDLTIGAWLRYLDMHANVEVRSIRADPDAIDWLRITPYILLAIVGMVIFFKIRKRNRRNVQI